jgi:hypothetical protein
MLELLQDRGWITTVATGYSLPRPDKFAVNYRRQSGGWPSDPWTRPQGSRDSRLVLWTMTIDPGVDPARNEGRLETQEHPLAPDRRQL